MSCDEEIRAEVSEGEDCLRELEEKLSESSKRGEAAGNFPGEGPRRRAITSYESHPALLALNLVEGGLDRLSNLPIIRPSVDMVGQMTNRLRRKNGFGARTRTMSEQEVRPMQMNMKSARKRSFIYQTGISTARRLSVIGLAALSETTQACGRTVTGAVVAGRSAFVNATRFGLNAIVKTMDTLDFLADRYFNVKQTEDGQNKVSNGAYNFGADAEPKTFRRPRFSLHSECEDFQEYDDQEYEKEVLTCHERLSNVRRMVSTSLEKEPRNRLLKHIACQACADFIICLTFLCTLCLSVIKRPLNPVHSLKSVAEMALSLLHWTLHLPLAICRNAVTFVRDFYSEILPGFLQKETRPYFENVRLNQESGQEAPDN